MPSPRRSIPFNTTTAVVLSTAVTRLAELQAQVPTGTPVADYPRLISTETLSCLHVLKARLAAFLPDSPSITTQSHAKESRHQFDLTAYDAEADDLDEVMFTGTFDEALVKADELAHSTDGTDQVAILLTLAYKD